MIKHENILAIMALLNLYYNNMNNTHLAVTISGMDVIKHDIIINGLST